MKTFAVGGAYFSNLTVTVPNRSGAISWRFPWRTASCDWSVFRVGKKSWFFK